MAFRSCRSAKAGWKYPWKWPVWLPALSPCWSTGGCSFLAVCPGCLTAEEKKRRRKTKPCPEAAVPLAWLKSDVKPVQGSESGVPGDIKKVATLSVPAHKDRACRTPAKMPQEPSFPLEKKVFLKYSLGFLVALLGMGGAGSSAPHCPKSTASSAPGHQHRHPQVTKTLLTPTFVPTAVYRRGKRHRSTFMNQAMLRSSCLPHLPRGASAAAI